MKNISKTIATLLVMFMLAGSVTSCLTYVHWSSPNTLQRVAFAVVDIVFLPISLIALLVYILINDADETESYAFLVNAESGFSTEYLQLLSRIYSLPEEKLASLKQILDSIPETKRAALIERLNSLSETERASLVRAFNALPEAEVLSSMERITALSETERLSLLQDFNALSEEELASVIEELESLGEVKYVAAAMNYPRQTAYIGFGFQY